MKKQILMTIIVLSVLTMMPITTKADYPTGTLGYSDEIVVGNEYEWTVKKFEFTGDFAAYTNYFQAGDILLSKGSKIKIVILEDPDTASGVWYDLYVDGVKSLDPEDFYIGGGIGYTYGASGFISPVTYTNATGTYNIYEQLFEEIPEPTTTMTTAYSTEYSGVTVVGDYSYVMEFKLVNDVFAVSMKLSYLTDVSGGYDYTEKVTIEIAVTLNTQTGLLGLSEMIYNVVTPGHSGTMHILVDSGYAKTTYEWAYSFLGLTVLVAVVGLIRRKRR